MLDISIAASIKPTEDSDSVVQAIKNMFPDADIIIKGEMALGTAEEIDHLVQRIMEQKIRDSARNFIHHSQTDGGFRFMLNKQAALMDRVNFVEEQRPLGDLVVEIAAEEPDSILQMLKEEME